MKIVIVAGGTGGHIYPGIALAEELKKRSQANEIIFLGSHDGMEKELVPKEGYEIKLINSRAILRKISYKAVSAPFLMIRGYFEALGFYKKYSPHLVIATGGYVSLPSILAAKTMGLPVFLLEQNVLPGMTVRLCRPLANECILSFQGSLKYIKGKVLGNPVRTRIITADRKTAREKLGYAPEDKVVLILGGSQGARKINQTIIDMLPMLKGDFKVLHIIGQRDYSRLKTKGFSFYKPVAYMHDIENALAAADLVVGRAGATALAEILVRGIPSILIPFPYSAEGHQKLNAQAAAKNKAAIMLEENYLYPQALIKSIQQVIADSVKMKEAAKTAARPNAAKEIVDLIYEKI